MKIVTIFAEKLFAFQYDSEKRDEYARLLDCWTDPEYLIDFAERNEQYLPSDMSVEDFTTDIQDDAEALEEALMKCIENNISLNTCFQPVHNQEYKSKILSFQKKKCKYLRLYAIKIDDDCFVITGGAIKLTRTMQDHPETDKELGKLDICKNYLNSERAFDKDSFYELIIEEIL
ncbi:MAG: hypothetical protein LBN93_12320 [Candidatus Symbiothrix sp.]|jgi:hypothetical protein|nr:hypothetical protein [Candidatus Symbiothrix sp.]